ncbi:hypothetical protein KY290_011042 [Solanum tuberosum]|uniref:Uncharacterized protein n=1 Tax=Solanum tuberosum TaxID=4113 RepID=A0ABQ7VZI7_SOLTU|nr:hypothetical protein KY290_011042 [Solanum tuberosum]
MPNPVVPKSLMNLFDELPNTQSLDEFWGELPKSKSSKRKHKTGQNKKACQESRRKAREEVAVEQQKRDALLAGASSSAITDPSSRVPADPMQVSESAPFDKGACTALTTGA